MTYPEVLQNKAQGTKSLPNGVKDILCRGSARMNFVEEEVLGAFRRWGYRRIITPLLEYDDLLSRGLDEATREEVLKFVEPETGRILALRPDITPQIARIVATRMMGWPRPIRLCYNESVFRRTGYPARQREIFQAGAELIGIDLPEADAEMVAVAIDAMKTMGLKNFKIDMGQIDFFRGILDSIGIDEERREKITHSISLKDRSGIEETLRDLPIEKRKKDLLLELPNLYGSGEEVIEKASSLVKNSRSLDALENLSSILRFLDIYGLREYITVDLGEVKGFNYYSGMVFEGFVEGLGREVLRGGRYDKLLDNYGYSCPATGLAFDVEGLSQALYEQKGEACEKEIDFLIFNAKEEKGEALEIATALRAKGRSVARDIIKRDYNASLEYSKKNNITSVIALGIEGVREGEAMVERVDTGEKKTLKVVDIIEGKRL